MTQPDTNTSGDTPKPNQTVGQEIADQYAIVYHEESCASTIDAALSAVEQKAKESTQQKALDTVEALINKLKARDEQLSAVQAERDELREALEGLSDMYAQAWDLVDGGLIMLDSSIPKFERAHARAQAVLAKGSKP